MPFEWQYLNRFRDARRLTLDAHHGPVDLVAFSADGNVLATSGISDGQLHLWEIPSGRHIASFPVRTKPAHRWEEEAAALSHDGRRVATLVDANTVVVWDAATGAELARCQHEHTVLTVVFSPDGSLVAAGDERETVLWSCDTAQKVSTSVAGRLLAFAPDGKRLAIVGPPHGASNVHLGDVPPSPIEPDLALPVLCDTSAIRPTEPSSPAWSIAARAAFIWLYHSAHRRNVSGNRRAAGRSVSPYRFLSRRPLARCIGARWQSEILGQPLGQTAGYVAWAGNAADSLRVLTRRSLVGDLDARRQRPRLGQTPIGTQRRAWRARTRWQAPWRSPPTARLWPPPRSTAASC